MRDMPARPNLDYLWRVAKYRGAHIGLNTSPLTLFAVRAGGPDQPVLHALRLNDLHDSLELAAELLATWLDNPKQERALT